MAKGKNNDYNNNVELSVSENIESKNYIANYTTRKNGGLGGHSGT